MGKDIGVSSEIRFQGKMIMPKGSAEIDLKHHALRPKGESSSSSVVRKGCPV